MRLMDRGDAASIEPIPPLFGRGYIETVKLGPEMGFTVTAHRPDGNDLPDRVTVKVRTEGPVARILSILETAPTTMGIVGDSRELPVASAQLSIASPDSELYYNDVPSKPYKAVALLIGLNRLAQAWEAEGPASVPKRYGFIQGRASSDPLLENLRFHPYAQGLIHKALDCPYRGAPRRLFLEGLGLEIAGIVISALATSGAGGDGKSPMHARDRKRMADALELLRHTAANPPSMEALALELGVSVSKLKRDFKAFAGIPVHAYIIQKRLDLARELLWAGAASVKEASYAVGFKSLSHFSQVYRRRFGEYPRDASKAGRL